MSSLALVGRRGFLALCGILAVAAPASAQRKAPEPPATYDAQIRYRIRAGRDERVSQYFEMTKFLESVGFKVTPGEDPNEPADSDAQFLRGTLPSSRVREVLREPHVRTLLLLPAGMKVPDSADARLLVRIELASGLSANRQRDLWFQASERLAAVGLTEKVGYDSDGHTRILGTIAATELDTLIHDLRNQPAGWLEKSTPREALPEPLRETNPIRVVEVLAEPEGVPANADVPPATDGDRALEKLSHDLRQLLGRDAPAGDAVRMDVVLTQAPTPDSNAWRTLLLSQAGLVIEGRLGQVVTIKAPPAAAKEIAASPLAASVRLARSATRPTAIAAPIPPADVMNITGLNRLHALNFRGAGMKIVVIDTDFKGFRDARTSFIDLTAARNPSLDPDPISTDWPSGGGARAAMAARLAAPEADLVLVRVDPAAAYMLLDVARYVHGDNRRPESLLARNVELRSDDERMRIARRQLAEERAKAADDFELEGEGAKRRADAAKKALEIAADEAGYYDRLRKFAALETALTDLRSARVVVCPLAWNTGYPSDGTGPLSRYLDETFFGLPRRGAAPPIWFQAAGDTRGQVWNGELSDDDRDGIFDFSPPAMPLPLDRWSRDLNFLAWQPAQGDRVMDIPAGAVIRVALQWSEVHDADLDAVDGQDVYRVPLADIRAMLLQQRDPTGAKVATDDFNVVARAAKLPQMIERTPIGATYESIVEFTATAGGRFAVRIDGSVPRFTRPTSVVSLPGQQRLWEPRARLFVEAIDAGSAGKGRIRFGDFPSNLGGIAMPGDSIGVRTVGAANAGGEPQSYSATGAPAGRELLCKPTFLAFDELPPLGTPGGTSQSAAFAGGIAASMFSAGVPAGTGLNWLAIRPNELLRVPQVWLEQLERRVPFLRER